jgi:AcrR family transcriptional regulator
VTDPTVPTGTSDSAQPTGTKPSAIARRRALARKERNASWLERREQILHAAADVFRAKGFQAAGISDVAARLGTDRANVYYYFASKEEMYLALVQQAVESNVRDIEQAADAEGSATERLLRAIESLAASYDRHYPYLHLYMQEDMRRVTEDSSEEQRHLAECSRRYDDAMLRITRDGVESGEFRAGVDPKMLKFAVLGAVNWTHRWFTPDGPMTGEEVGRAFSDIFLRGFAAHPAEDP